MVRAYLVGNFGFDDTQLKTLGMGKKLGETADAGSGWGQVEIVVYPSGTSVPAGPGIPKATIVPTAAVN